MNPWLQSITSSTPQNGTPAFPSTKVSLCHDGKFLSINATMVDAKIVSTLKGCNSNLFTEDVFEVFVATPSSYPYNYFEIEVSPKGELFFADIENHNLNCSSFKTQYQECGRLQYGANVTEKGWDAWLRLNLTIIGRGKVERELMVNMFRIDKTPGDLTVYQCWLSTMASPACFHKPAFFQKLILD